MDMYDMESENQKQRWNWYQKQTKSMEKNQYSLQSTKKKHDLKKNQI